MKGVSVSHGTTTEHKIVKREKGIIYFEGGWWCHEADWWTAGVEREPRNGIHTTLRRNEETKQIEIDRFILP